MSIAAMCSRDSLTIKRLVTTQGTAGGQVRTYTTAARGALPTTGVSCRIQPVTADERREYGIKGERLGWTLFFNANPSLTVQDHLFFTDADGSSIEARVVNPSRNVDNQSRLWVAVGEEYTTQT